MKRMRKNAGHSLMELTIVIIIVGVLAAAMMVAMQSQSLHRLSAAAERVASDIRYAQQLAAATGKIGAAAGTTLIKVKFSVGNHYEVTWVTVGNAAENNVVSPLQPGNAAENFIVDFDDAGSPHNGVSISTLPDCQAGITPVAEEFFFDATGAPLCCNSGHVACAKMTQGNSVILSYGGRTKTISVEPETGLVSVP